MSNNNRGSIKRTLREKKFIESYIDNCGNATESYLSISPDVTRDSAKELGKRMVAKVGLSIVEVLDKMGLTDPVISQKLIDGLKATRETGTGKDRKEKADHQAIVKYLDMILKLKASYPADRSKLELTGKDGKPLGPPTINLRHIHYIECPLKDQCPIKGKVQQVVETQRKEKDKDKKE